jgi:type II secretory pathway pseudopilin PulG
MRNILNRKKSQVWVETAIYTLIGLTIIAIVFSVATPQIERMKESNILTQTLDALNNLDNEINKVAQVSGNIKIINFKISKGKLIINSSTNNLTYVLENTPLEFSQNGTIIKEGNVYILTEEYGKNYNVYLTTSYPGLDITHNDENTLLGKILHGGGTPYQILLENKGAENIDDPIQIDIRLS